MFIKTNLNLDIQIQYLAILRDFLDSEHKALQYGEFYDVFQLEKSIHGILKSIQEKRAELRDDLMGLTVREYASELPDNMGDVLRRKMDFLAKFEENCLARASRNADLSMILAGQKVGSPEHWTFHGTDEAVEGRVQ